MIFSTFVVLHLVFVCQVVEAKRNQISVGRRIQKPGSSSVRWPRCWCQARYSVCRRSRLHGSDKEIAGIPRQGSILSENLQMPSWSSQDLISRFFHFRFPGSFDRETGMLSRCSESCFERHGFGNWYPLTDHNTFQWEYPHLDVASTALPKSERRFALPWLLFCRWSAESSLDLEGLDLLT